MDMEEMMEKMDYMVVVDEEVLDTIMKLLEMVVMVYV